MGKRDEIDAQTIAAVAARNAGHPLSDARAASYAPVAESVLSMMDRLRALPLKNVEPSLIFRPETLDHDV